MPLIGFAATDADGLTESRLAELITRLPRLSPHQLRIATAIASTGCRQRELSCQRSVCLNTTKNTLSEIYRRLEIDRTHYGHPEVVLVRMMWASGHVRRDS